MEYFPRFSSLAILQEIQEDLAKKNIKPEEFEDQIIFMSMFNDVDGQKESMIIIVSRIRFCVMGRKRSGMGNLLPL